MYVLSFSLFYTVCIYKLYVHSTYFEGYSIVFMRLILSFFFPNFFYEQDL